MTKKILKLIMAFTASSIVPLTVLSCNNSKTQNTENKNNDKKTTEVKTVIETSEDTKLLNKIFAQLKVSTDYDFDEESKKTINPFDVSKEDISISSSFHDQASTKVTKLSPNEDGTIDVHIMVKLLNKNLSKEHIIKMNGYSKGWKVQDDYGKFKELDQNISSFFVPKNKKHKLSDIDASKISNSEEFYLKFKEDVPNSSDYTNYTVSISSKFKNVNNSRASEGIISITTEVVITYDVYDDEKQQKRIWIQPNKVIEIKGLKVSQK